MKYGKRIALVAGSALLVTALGACHRHPHPGYGSQHILRHLDRKVSSLDLNQGQEQKYQALRARLESSLEEQFRERKSFMSQMEQEMGKENPDMDQLTRDVKERIKLSSTRFSEKADLFREFYDILDDDQKRELRGDIRKFLHHVNR